MIRQDPKHLLTVLKLPVLCPHIPAVVPDKKQDTDDENRKKDHTQHPDNGFLIFLQNVLSHTDRNLTYKKVICALNGHIGKIILFSVPGTQHPGRLFCKSFLQKFCLFPGNIPAFQIPCQKIPVITEFFIQDVLSFKNHLISIIHDEKICLMIVSGQMKCGRHILCCIHHTHRCIFFFIDGKGCSRRHKKKRIFSFPGSLLHDLSVPDVNILGGPIRSEHLPAVIQKTYRIDAQTFLLISQEREQIFHRKIPARIHRGKILVNPFCDLPAGIQFVCKRKLHLFHHIKKIFLAVCIHIFAGRPGIIQQQNANGKNHNDGSSFQSVIN